MWKSSLKVKVTVALVIAIALLDAIGYGVAQRNFRDAEIHNARGDSQNRVTSMATVLEIRLQEMLDRVNAAAGRLHRDEVEDVVLDLRLQKFGAIIILGPGGAYRAVDGEAATNATLKDEMMGLRNQFISRHVNQSGPWLLVAARAHDFQHTVIVAMHRDVIRETVLERVRIDEHPVLLKASDGTLIAAAVPDTFNATGKTLLGAIGGPIPPRILDTHLHHQAPLRAIDANVVELVPTSELEARADILAFRFFLISTVVLSISGLVTLWIVARSLRPLGQITRAAEQLSHGAESLDLDIRTRDEMQVLADVLVRAARDIGEARRRQEAFAESLRVAAQDFEVAVGGLARSVGEAGTHDEIARRLSDAILRVSGCRAVAVLRGDEVLEARSIDSEGTSVAVQALVASDPDAFQWFSLGDDEENARAAILPREDQPLTQGERRKVEILGAQAAFAFHRARATESIRIARDELDKSLRQKQIFVDILSHDLKNPLAVARGRVQMLGLKHPDLAEKTRAIEQSIDRAVGIIEEAVVYSRLDAHRGIDRPLSDVAAFAEEAAASLRPLAAQRNIRIEVRAPQDPRFPANRLLVRAIENLVSNAIKWSPENGDVALVIDRDDDAMRIRIVDHGPGIPPEDRPRLFARFERADRTGVKGTGLGLAICKRIVDLHDGAITIEDTPGGGATFVVSMPLAPAESPTATPTTPGGLA